MASAPAVYEPELFREHVHLLNWEYFQTQSEFLRYDRVDTSHWVRIPGDRNPDPPQAPGSSNSARVFEFLTPAGGDPIVISVPSACVVGPAPSGNSTKISIPTTAGSVAVLIPATVTQSSTLTAVPVSLATSTGAGTPSNALPVGTLKPAPAPSPTGTPTASPGLTVIAISHVWETAASPDVTKSQFKSVKAFIQRRPTPEQYAVFYDYSSVPQKDDDGKVICLPGFTEPQTKRTFEMLLKGMDQLYGGRLHTPTITLNACPNDVYQQRTWPYYEVYISRIYGTINTDFGRAELPLLSWCDRLVSGITLDEINALLAQRVFIDHTIGSILDTLHGQMRDLIRTKFEEAMAKSEDVGGDWMFDALGLEALRTAYESFGHVCTGFDREIFRSTEMPTQSLFDRLVERDFKHSPIRLSLASHLRPLLKMFLSNGLVYALLGTTVTNGKDRDEIIEVLEARKEEHYQAYVEERGLGQEWH
ncbi:hypothetical protein HDU87_007266 [Geranomyces variabilis]|uniref:Uncharacterized protein n=1 Tax=Geranomyces variabilis TaxID=109894 RepID=A0AAD5XPY3_9FUNG|nr:hypothetical protein HDU87_007266 [Geranomyces variabilis]